VSDHLRNLGIGRRLVAGAVLLVAAGGYFVTKYWPSVDGLREVRAALRQFDSRHAVQLLKQIDDHDSDGERAYLSAVAHRQQGDIAAATRALELARRKGYSRRRVEQQEKLLAFQSGYVDETSDYLLKWLAQPPNDDDAAQIYDCLVRGYLAAVRLDEAAYCIALWLRWKPDDVRPLWLRAEVERTQRDFAKTTATYREILRRTPDDAEAHFELGRLLVDNNDAAAAIEHVNWYHERRPNDVEVLVYLAKCQRRLGAQKQARVLLEQALSEIAADEVRAEALIELGQIQMKEDSPQLARDSLRQAVELAPANAAAHYALALAAARLGHKEEADRQFAESERIEAQNERLADLAREILHQPTEADLRSEAGQIMLDQGRDEEARVWLVSALYYDPDHEAARRALARCDERPQSITALPSPPSREPKAPQAP
jgi:Flp pilus assembly protein TadD